MHIAPYIFIGVFCHNNLHIFLCIMKKFIHRNKNLLNCPLILVSNLCIFFRQSTVTRILRKIYLARLIKNNKIRNNNASSSLKELLKR